MNPRGIRLNDGERPSQLRLDHGAGGEIDRISTSIAPETRTLLRRRQWRIGASTKISTIIDAIDGSVNRVPGAIPVGNALRGSEPSMAIEELEAMRNAGHQLLDVGAGEPLTGGKL